MFDKDDKTAFNRQLSSRVKKLRERRGWSIRQTAKNLGIPEDRYSLYENGSPLPAYLIPKFAALMATSISYLITGKHEKWPLK
jgi:transcriptional regulator with XRE-family HTH domain